MNLPDIFGLTQGQFETFLLLFVRVTTIMYLIPIFSAQQVPNQVRIAFGLLVTFVLYPVVPPIAAIGGLGELTGAIFSQVMIGFCYGFVGFLVFTGVEFAGEILDITVGFAVVNVINPLTSQSVSVLGEFELALASLIYLAVDGHHLLIEGIGGSFNLVPLPYLSIQPDLMTDIMGFFARSLLLVFQIAGPIAISLFIVNIGLSLMARVAPQLNVFAVGLPLQIVVGLTMMFISMPLLGVVLPQVFDQTPRELDAVLRQLRAPG